MSCPVCVQRVPVASLRTIHQRQLMRWSVVLIRQTYGKHHPLNIQVQCVCPACGASYAHAFPVFQLAYMVQEDAALQPSYVRYVHDRNVERRERSVHASRSTPPLSSIPMSCSTPPLSPRSS